MLELNSNAPLFCLPDSGNNEVCLKDYKGKWVVLYFYPKDNTPGCTKEACDFSINITDFNNLDATIIGISGDSVASHKKFKDKYSLKITLLSDPDHKVLKDYGVWKPKKLFGKEVLGVVRTTFIINPDAQIAYIWPKVKVKTHILEVKEKLQELSGKK